MALDSAARGRSRRWLTWTRIVVEGLALGGIQLLLLFASGYFTTRWLDTSSLTLMGLLSACAFLVVLLVEGFRASWRTGKIRSGITAAWPIASISVLPTAIPLVTLGTITLLTPHSGYCENCGLYFLAGIGLIGSALVIGLWSWLVSTFGGWIGGLVAKLYQL